MNPGPDALEELLTQLIHAMDLHRPLPTSSGQALSLSELLALSHLAGAAPLSQRDLAVRLRLEKSTVSRMVAGLEQRGCVARLRDPANRRHYQVTLTVYGQGLVEGMRSTMRDRHQRLLATLTSGEREAMETGIRALIRVLDATS
ncbi:MAG TPA: MarR family transcriptional regulator [Candidatus Dormibacteraeota bacterium]|jgi:DNA-binding MarR family transcriptional regulator|nr:MarR family transcriptional regulator [Candidatus Dormibacteraeota bacterium]